MREIDWAGLRADLTQRKAKAIDDMPELIERFTREAEAVGAKVYRAVDADEARHIVTAICRAKKAKLVVKSKSMATEEIGLTDHLESQGIHAVETDLGEWIIQLAGERPSHLIAPAIHKTREEVAALFSKVVGHPVADDVASLVAVARKELRQSFIDADVGITGGNALIADTGTLLLVTNEGNADLATTHSPGTRSDASAAGRAATCARATRKWAGTYSATSTRGRSASSSRRGITASTASPTSRPSAWAAMPATRSAR